MAIVAEFSPTVESVISTLEARHDREISTLDADFTSDVQRIDNKNTLQDEGISDLSGIMETGNFVTRGVFNDLLDTPDQFRTNRYLFTTGNNIEYHSVYDIKRHLLQSGTFGFVDLFDTPNRLEEGKFLFGNTGNAFSQQSVKVCGEAAFKFSL